MIPLLVLSLTLAAGLRGPDTATLTGRVLDDRGTPVSGASVILIGGPAPGSRPVITMDDGRFTIDDIAPAVYSITIAKGGHPTVRYGQPRPTARGTPIAIKAGERLTLDLRLPRGAVIAGTVLDDTGDPVGGSRIVLRRQGPLGSLVRDYNVVANARGDYRAFGLAAGTYRIAAVTAPDAERRAEPPGSVTVTVAAGDERDVDLVAAARPRTSGVIVVPIAPPGQALRYPQISLRRPGDARTSFFGVRNPDESTTFSGVPAGLYKAIVHAGPAWGSADVVADGEHAVSVQVALVPGHRITGRVTFAGSSPRPARRQSLYLLGSDLDGIAVDDAVLMGEIRDDGAFTIAGVPPGRFLIAVVGGHHTDTWTIGSAIAGGLDVTDVPLVMGTDDIGGVDVTMTDAKTVARGTIAAAGGGAANGRQVVFYPADAHLRGRHSRRVAVATTDVDGRFEIVGLPPGTYAVAVVDEIDRQAPIDPALFDSLERVATVTLRSGETRTLNATER